VGGTCLTLILLTFFLSWVFSQILDPFFISFSFWFFDFWFVMPPQNKATHTHTQLAIQLQQECIQVVCSNNREARKRSAEPNCTLAMDLEFDDKRRYSSIRGDVLSFFLEFRRPNLNTGLSAWQSPNFPLRTREPVPDRRTGALPSLWQTKADP